MNAPVADRLGLPLERPQIRLARIVSLYGRNAATPDVLCYLTTYTVRWIDATFDTEDETPAITGTNRSSTLTVVAAAPAGQTFQANQVVTVCEANGHYWILEPYCNGVSYFPGLCDPFEVAASYIPMDSGECEEAPEFGYYFDLGTAGANCCGGNASGRVCLTNDSTGNVWRSATFDCGGDDAYWELDVSAGTVTLYADSEVLIQYTLIGGAWCCLGTNQLRLACPPDDPCATDWPQTICVRPLTEFCAGGSECDYTLYDFTVEVSGFSGGTGGCCSDFNGTWVMSHQSGLIFTSPSSAACSDGFQRNWALTQLFNGKWQLQGTVIGTSDTIIYLADELSCVAPTVFTEFSNDTGCSVPGAPSTLTVTPSLA